VAACPGVNQLSVESLALQRRMKRDGVIVELTVDKSSAQAAVTRGPNRVRLKNLYFYKYKPLLGNGW
jgi:hypothetical protein